MFTEYVESLWTAGRRSVADLTAEEMAKATALWCRHRPVDAESAVLTDTHVEDRVAHRLFEYFDALAAGDIKAAQVAETGLSAMLTNVARQHVEAHIKRVFELNTYLSDFLRRVEPAKDVA